MGENTTMSPADVMAMTHNDNGMMGSWIWVILFIVLFGFNGFGGNNATRTATAEDINNGFNFAALERQNNETIAAIRQGVYDTTGAVKDASYNNLSELRDIQMQMNTGFSNAQNCCCEIKQGLMENRYLGAQNTASINATTVEQSQKILDALAQNKIDALQNRINTLEMQGLMSNVVRYPTQFSYNAGPSPFCGCSGCGM